MPFSMVSSALPRAVASPSGERPSTVTMSRRITEKPKPPGPGTGLSQHSPPIRASCMALRRTVSSPASTPATKGSPPSAAARYSAKQLRLSLLTTV